MRNFKAIVPLLLAVSLVACSSIKSEAFNGSNTDSIVRDVAHGDLSSIEKKEISESLSRASVGAYDLKGKTVATVLADEASFDAAYAPTRIKDLVWYVHAVARDSEANQLMDEATKSTSSYSDRMHYLDLAARSEEAAASDATSDYGTPDGWDDVASNIYDYERGLLKAIHAVQNCSSYSSLRECQYAFQQAMLDSEHGLRAAGLAANTHYRALGGNNIENDELLCTLARTVPKVFDSSICGDPKDWKSP